MNRNTLQGQWKQLKGDIRKHWGKLTDDDIYFMEGSFEKMVGRIQQRYGIAREEAERQVESWQH